MLEEGEALQARLRDLLEMKEEGEEEEESTAKSIAARMWPLVGKYSYMNREGQGTDVMYIMDEVGSRFCEVFPRRSLGLKFKNNKKDWDDNGNDEGLTIENVGAGFRCALVFHPVTNEAFTAFWPRRAVMEGEIATCDNLPHGQAARLARLQVLKGVDTTVCIIKEREEERKKEKMIETAHHLRRFLEREGYCEVGRINALLGLEAMCGKLLPVWDISEPQLRAGFVTQLETATGRTSAGSSTTSSSSSISTAGASDAAAASPSSLTFLIKFFLMSMAVPRAELLKFVPDYALLQQLEDLGLLFVEGQDDDNDDPTSSSSSGNSSSNTLVKSLVQITPVPFRSAGESAEGYGCGLFLTDFAQVGSGGGGFDPVMYVGPDSLGLVGAMHSYADAAATTTAAAGAAASGKEKERGGSFSSSPSYPLPVPRRILDVCAGCGVQGIVAALRTQQEQQRQQQQQQQEPIIQELTLIELNPRAVRFATFNAALNHLQNQTTVLQKDVRIVTPADLPFPVYDIVLSNPPYIPNPEKSARQLHQYGDGGATGEEITQGVVALAAQVLTQKKNEKEGEEWLYLVGNLVNVDTLPGRVEKWWGDGLRLQGKQLQQEEKQQQQQLEIKAFHGLKWSPAEYAALIHNHRLEDTAMALVQDAAVGRYKEALEGAGVRGVTNGLVFVQCSREGKKEEVGVSESSSNSDGGSESSTRCKKAVVALHEQLWQILAMYKDPEASEARRKLAEGWM